MPWPTPREGSSRRPLTTEVGPCSPFPISCSLATHGPSRHANRNTPLDGVVPDSRERGASMASDTKLGEKDLDRSDSDADINRAGQRMEPADEGVVLEAAGE